MEFALIAKFYCNSRDSVISPNRLFESRYYFFFVGVRIISLLLRVWKRLFVSPDVRALSSSLLSFWYTECFRHPSFSSSQEPRSNSHYAWGLPWGKFMTERHTALFLRFLSNTDIRLTARCCIIKSFQTEDMNTAGNRRWSYIPMSVHT